MDGIVSDGSEKRRLPMWMLGVSAADKVGELKNVEVDKDEEIVEKEGTAPQGRPSKSRARRPPRREKGISLPSEDALEEEQSSLVVKRETTRRKRKASPKDVDTEKNDVQETVFQKSKRSVGRRTNQKTASGRRGKVESLECESSDDIEDDGDLTMEDLMSIAKEFVKDDKDVEQQKKSDGERKADGQYDAVDLSRNEPTSSLCATETERRTSKHNETASCLNPTENLTSEEFIVNPRRTGDPAQDMLDLFLGPLLKKKPLEEEKKAELITDDMIVAHECKKRQKVAIGDVPVPLTKKKTSLKDKVAMFLD